MDSGRLRSLQLGLLPFGLTPPFRASFIATCPVYLPTIPHEVDVKSLLDELVNRLTAAQRVHDRR